MIEPIYWDAGYFFCLKNLYVYDVLLEFKSMNT